MNEKALSLQRSAYPNILMVKSFAKASMERQRLQPFSMLLLHCLRKFKAQTSAFGRDKWEIRKNRWQKKSHIQGLSFRTDWGRSLGGFIGVRTCSRSSWGGIRVRFGAEDFCSCSSFSCSLLISCSFQLQHVMGLFRAYSLQLRRCLRCRRNPEIW